jgi:hypothetical protein
VNEEGVTAVLGLVLLTQPDHEVRVPIEIIENGLPADSGVQVYQDQETDELVIKIQSYDTKEAE